MHIVTRPDSPTTSRTMSEVSLRSGMKSISVATPSSVSKRVSRISVSGTIFSAGAEFLRRRRDPPAAVVGGAEQCRKARIGIEPRPAQPVDRAVARNQRRGFAVPDQRIVRDARWSLATQSVKSMTTLMSSGRCSSASCQFDSGTRREISRPSQALVGLAERRRGHFIVPAVGVDRTEHHVVVEHHRAVELPEVERRLVVAAEAEQAHNPAWRRAAENTGDERRHSSAFDDDVRRKLDDVADRPGEIKRAEVADEARLRPIGRAVEHIDVIVRAACPSWRREARPGRRRSPARAAAPRSENAGRCARCDPMPWRRCWSAPAARRARRAPDRP